MALVIRNGFGFKAERYVGLSLMVLVSTSDLLNFLRGHESMITSKWITLMLHKC